MTLGGRGSGGTSLDSEGLEESGDPEGPGASAALLSWHSALGNKGLGKGGVKAGGAGW